MRNNDNDSGWMTGPGMALMLAIIAVLAYVQHAGAQQYEQCSFRMNASMIRFEDDSARYILTGYVSDGLSDEEPFTIEILRPAYDDYADDWELSYFIGRHCQSAKTNLTHDSLDILTYESDGPARHVDTYSINGDYWTQLIDMRYPYGPTYEVGPAPMPTFSAYVPIVR